MEKLLGVVGGRFALFVFLLFLVAGCNEGGLKGDDDVPAPTSVSLPSGDTFGGPETSAGATIAQVHNPEPASMALMGIGLAALLRRKKIIKG